VFHLAAAAIDIPSATNVLVAGCGGGQELVTFSHISSQCQPNFLQIDDNVAL
jgi:hypothetical protein